MPRVEPDNRTRLASAALHLFAAQGYENTTVAQIAARAGVTSRTFFRYFPDKREVLFVGADPVRQRIVTSLHDAPTELGAFSAAMYAVAACGDLFHRRDLRTLRRRAKVVATSGELREREALKLAAVADDVALGLVRRGVGRTEAGIAGDLAALVFEQASWLWFDAPDVAFGMLVDRAAGVVRAVIDGPSAA